MEEERDEYASQAKTVHHFRQEVHPGRKWGQVENYHLAVDTSVVGIDGTVDLLEACAKLKGDKE